MGTAGADSLVGENVSLLDKSVVKKRIVGRGSTIREASKVLNSVLMEQVSIGEQFSVAFFASLFILSHTESLYCGEKDGHR